MPTYSAKHIELKIVYYGPALCGKTTNLQRVHEMLRSDLRGKLISMSNVKDDRTIFFDLLPIQVKFGDGYTLSAKLFTVPGQVAYNHTRKLVLQNVDGLVFVADSQRTQAKANAYSFQNLQNNLRALQIDPDAIPLVMQFNKRDLTDVRPMAELEAAWKARGVPVTASSAVTGEGIMETLEEVLRVTFRAFADRQPLLKKFGLTEENFIRSVRENFTPPASPVSASGQPQTPAPV